MLRKLLLSSVLTAGLAAPALAGPDLQIIGVGLPDAQAFGAAVIDNYSYYVGPVELHTATADYLAFCADLNHDLQSGSYYTFGYLTQNGNGGTIDATLSDKIRQLAALGVTAENNHDGYMASAVQLYIWSLEYNLLPTSYGSNSDEKTDFDFLVNKTFTDQHQLARVIIPYGNPAWPDNLSLSQQMIITRTGTRHMGHDDPRLLRVDIHGASQASHFGLATTGTTRCRPRIIGGESMVEHSFAGRAWGTSLDFPHIGAKAAQATALVVRQALAPPSIHGEDPPSSAA